MNTEYYEWLKVANIIMATFDGYEIRDGKMVTTMHILNGIEDLLLDPIYHCDWNQLHRVHIKFINLIVQEQHYEQMELFKSKIAKQFSLSDIKASFSELYEAIKWYNSIKK